MDSVHARPNRYGNTQISDTKLDRTLRMLVTEDDMVSRRIMAAYLAEFGECDIAADGYEAVNRIQAALTAGRSYDLVFLNILMPNMDGQRALRVIRHLEDEAAIPQEKQTHVIMTTAFNDPSNILKAFNRNCEAYLVKPVTRTKLCNLLEELGYFDFRQQLTE